MEGALDVAAFKVEATHMVVQSVMTTRKVAAIGSHSIPCDSQCHYVLLVGAMSALFCPQYHKCDSPQTYRSTEAWSTHSRASNMIL
jgi:hypothetical protein